jgi:hypothetical protein
VLGGCVISQYGPINTQTQQEYGANIVYIAIGSAQIGG